VSLLVLLGGLYFAVVAGHGILKYLRNLTTHQISTRPRGLAAG